MHLKALILLIPALTLAVTNAEETVHKKTSSKDVPVADAAELIKDVVEVQEDTKERFLGKPTKESITLYKHDAEAGVYRTETGDLVRMYRVEKVARSQKRPKITSSKRRSGDGRWLMNDFYGNYGGLYDPMLYGAGGIPYSYNYNYYTYPYGYNYNYGVYP